MWSPLLSCNHQFSFQSYPLGLLALVTTNFVSLSPKAPLQCFAPQVCFPKIKYQHSFFNNYVHLMHCKLATGKKKLQHELFFSSYNASSFHSKIYFYCMHLLQCLNYFFSLLNMIATMQAWCVKNKTIMQVCFTKEEKKCSTSGVIFLLIVGPCYNTCLMLEEAQKRKMKHIRRMFLVLLIVTRRK